MKQIFMFGPNSFNKAVQHAYMKQVGKHWYWKNGQVHCFPYHENRQTRRTVMIAPDGRFASVPQGAVETLKKKGFTSI